MEPLRAYLGTAEVKIRVEDDPDSDREVVFLEVGAAGLEADVVCRLTSKEAAELSAFLALAAAAVAQREIGPTP